MLVANDKLEQALAELESLKALTPKESLVYFLIGKVGARTLLPLHLLFNNWQLGYIWKWGKSMFCQTHFAGLCDLPLLEVIFLYF